MHFTPADYDAYLKAQPVLRSYCNSLARNHHHAEDLFQDTLLRAWDKSDHFAPGTNMRAWLTSIAFNSFMSECRKARRTVYVGTAADAEAWSQGPRAQLPAQIARLEMNEMTAALQALPAAQSDAVLAVAIGHSYEQTAAETNTAIGTVKSRVNRARVALEQALRADPETPASPAAPTQPVIGWPLVEAATRLKVSPQLIEPLRHRFGIQAHDMVDMATLTRLATHFGYPLQPDADLYASSNRAAPHLGIDPGSASRLFGRIARQIDTAGAFNLGAIGKLQFHLAFDCANARVRGYVLRKHLPALRRHIERPKPRI